MKQEFSTKWIESKQPRKQKKYRFNAPLHIKHKFLSANLSKELRKKYNKRTLPLRKDDEVLIMRGSFKKKKAKVSSIDLKRSKIILENINRSKRDGSKVSVSFNPSVLQIHALGSEDKRLKRVKKSETKESKDNKK
jgi:large subunit ribosomal protein L24